MPNPVVASTGDLYSGENEPPINGSTPLYPPNAAPVGDLSKNLGAPPSAPTPIPPPTQPVRQTETVIIKKRMADETPDGKVRDTSMEAMRPGNDLGFRNLDDESTATPVPPEAPPTTQTATEQKPPEAPPAPPTPAPEKVYAGKYKTPEELEKAYLEAQRAMHAANEKAATLEREKQQATPPPPKTPQQVAADEARKTEFLSKFVEDPEGVILNYQNQAIQKTQTALAAQQVATKWREQNPDLAKTVEIEGTNFSGEDIVAIIAAKIAHADAATAANPDALISKATALARQYFGTLRTEGAKEALTQETRVIPLVTNTAPAAATEHPSSKAPLNADDAFNLHIRMLKESEQKSHRGLRR